MQTTDGNNENIPTSPDRLSPLQIPKYEPLSPQSPSPQVSKQGQESSLQGQILLRPSPPAPPQNLLSGPPSPSSSRNSMHESHLMPPPTTMTTTTTTNTSLLVTSSPKIPICGPPSPSELSSSPPQFPMHEFPSMPPPPPQLVGQQSPMMHPHPHYLPPLGMPPPFPYFSAPYPPYYPMIPGHIHNGQVFKQPWSTGLFDCFSDFKNCFITCLCPCVTFGQVDEMLSEGQMAWWESALMFGLLETLCFSQASFVFAWYHRAKFRKKYNLMGNLFSEFAITLICTRLVLCQNYRQLNRMGFDVALGWKANKKKQRRMASQGAVQVMPPAVNPGMFR